MSSVPTARAASRASRTDHDHLFAGDQSRFDVQRACVARDAWLEPELVIAEFVEQGTGEAHVIGFDVRQIPRLHVTALAIGEHRYDETVAFFTSAEMRRWDQTGSGEVEELAPAQAAALLAMLIDATRVYGGGDFASLGDPGIAATYGALAARLPIGLAHEVPSADRLLSPLDSPLDDLAPAEVVDGFLASPELADELLRGASTAVATRIAEWVTEEARWPSLASCSVGRACELLDTAGALAFRASPAAATGDVDAVLGDLIASIRAWIRFAATHSGAGPEAAHASISMLEEQLASARE